MLIIRKGKLNYYSMLRETISYMKMNKNLNVSFPNLDFKPWGRLLIQSDWLDYSDCTLMQ